MEELAKKAQAILFAAGEPYEKEKLAECLQVDLPTLDEIIKKINTLFKKTAFVILDLEQYYQMVTRKEYADIIRQALEIKSNAPLSQAALEVLAIIAYNQPVTRSFIEQVRGVDSASVINSLVTKRLIEEQGRLEIPGRPIAYGTTEHFLRCFGMTNIEALPKLSQLGSQMDEEAQNE